MRIIDREPLSNIVTPATPLEDPARPALPEVPTVEEAFKNDTPGEGIVEIGRKRLSTKLLFTIFTGLSKIKNSVDWLKRRGSGRSRRNRGCGRCRIENNNSSACLHPGIPGLKLNPPARSVL